MGIRIVWDFHVLGVQWKASGLGRASEFRQVRRYRLAIFSCAAVLTLNGLATDPCRWMLGLLNSSSACSLEATMR